MEQVSKAAPESSLVQAGAILSGLRLLSRGSAITGVIDWSEASQGDALYDLAILTLGHEEHLGDVVAGYRTDVDLDVIRAWWSWRSLVVVRWLAENGFGPIEAMPEVAVLRSALPTGP